MSKQTSKDWYLKNRESELAKSKADYQKNGERIRAQRKIRYFMNRENEIAGARNWNLQNSEKFREIMSRYYKNHREIIIAKVKPRVRIRREKIRGISPISVILNEKFEGSELHHTGVEMDGGFIGVYLSKSLNRGHCAQFGKEKNLDKVNYDAVEFLSRRWNL